MSGPLASALRAAFARGEAAVLVRVARARGSTPREAGAAMLITASTQAGTVGGGALEWHAAARAREMLKRGEASAQLEMPLGPEIGQCCGGRVTLALARADERTLAEIDAEEAAVYAAQPHVLIFGAGHVGRAVAEALAPLPFRVAVIDTRAEALAGLPSAVAVKCAALPEAEVAAAPPGSAFIALTHSHALDFLIAEAALARRDAAYVGMIGSKSKRAQFARFLADQGKDSRLLVDLTLPIGGDAVGDKRPAVIAALVAAEVATVLLAKPRLGGRLAGRHPATQVAQDA